MLGRLRTSVAPGATTRTEFRDRGKNAHGVLYLGPVRAQSFATGGHNAHGIRYPGKYAHLEGIKWPLTVHVGPGYLRRCA